MPTLTSISTALQLGAHIRALRKARGLTQSDVAKMLGVSKMRVATIEKDIGRVSTASVLELVHLLGGNILLQLSAIDEASPDDRVTKPDPAEPNRVTRRARRGEW